MRALLLICAFFGMVELSCRPGSAKDINVGHFTHFSLHFPLKWTDIVHLSWTGQTAVLKESVTNFSYIYLLIIQDHFVASGDSRLHFKFTNMLFH